MTIASRLTAALVALFLCTAGLVGVSWTTQQKQSGAVDALYSVSVTRIRDLKIVADRYAVNIIDAANKARAGVSSVAQARRAMRDATDEINKIWLPIRRAGDRPEQRELMEKLDAKMANATNVLHALVAVLGKGDRGLIDDKSITDAYAAIDPVTGQLQAIIDAEFAAAQKTRQEALEAGNISTIALTLVALLALGLSGASIAYMTLGVVRPLRNSIATMSELSAATVGAANSSGSSAVAEIEAIAIKGAGRPDEIGQMAKTLKTFKQSSIERQLLRTSAEKEQGQREARARRIEDIIHEFETAAASIVATVASASTELEAAAKSMMELATNTGAAASQVLSASAELARQSSNMRKKVDWFLDAVRAA